MYSFEKFIQEKAKNKRTLLGTMFHPRTPVIAVDFSNGMKMDKNFLDMLEGFEKMGITTLVITPIEGAKKIEGAKHVRILPPEEYARALEVADFAVVFDDAGMRKAWKTGCVPIGPMDGEATINYNPLAERGNGFFFKEKTKWAIFSSVIRALETYQFPYDWENLIKGILRKF